MARIRIDTFFALFGQKLVPDRVKQVNLCVIFELSDSELVSLCISVKSDGALHGDAAAVEGLILRLAPLS